MPLYEYICKPCSQKFEMLRPMSQANQNALCPKCEAPAIRAISVFASFVAETSGDWSPVAGGGGGGCGGCGPGGCACSR